MKQPFRFWLSLKIELDSNNRGSTSRSLLKGTEWMLIRRVVTPKWNWRFSKGFKLDCTKVQKVSQPLFFLLAPKQTYNSCFWQQHEHGYECWFCFLAPEKNIMLLLVPNKLPIYDMLCVFFSLLLEVRDLSIKTE